MHPNATMCNLSATVSEAESGTDAETTKALAATANSAPTPMPKRASRSEGFTMNETKATPVARITVDRSLMAAPQPTRSRFHEIR